jgi:UDP-2,4-diacetamido-2,4,6-trideoxy-beta-L-altropyranose hydrolase
MTMNGTRFLIRTDSSTEIGSGHVMRTLTVAEALRKRGAVCHFVCRQLERNIAHKVTAAGFELTLLSAPTEPFKPAADTPAHAPWVQVDWQQDATETASVLNTFDADWVILDHYGLDARWSRCISDKPVGKIVIDDLADRIQDADILLDQGIARTAKDYAGKVDPSCHLLCGMSFALLRPVFAAQRRASIDARLNSQDGRLLISLGGYDRENRTEAILRQITHDKPPRISQIDVVMGSLAPHRTAVQECCEAMPIPTSLHIDTSDMVGLMSKADLAVGGAGVTAIERCVMGLPTLTVVQADNQIAQARLLHESGAVLLYDDQTAEGCAKLGQQLEHMMDTEIKKRMSLAAAEICDGMGLERVIDVISDKVRLG